MEPAPDMINMCFAEFRRHDAKAWVLPLTPAHYFGFTLGAVLSYCID